MSLYRYFGIRFGRIRERISLDNVKFQNPNDGSHVAVWLGAATRDARQWVQGGVEQSSFENRPYAYVEIGSKHQQIAQRQWPVDLKQQVKVKLIRRKTWWKVRIKVGKMVFTTRSIRIDRPVTDSMLEISGHAAGIGTISGRRVHGNTISIKRRANEPA